jgi:hypothetical protein
MRAAIARGLREAARRGLGTELRLLLGAQRHGGYLPRHPGVLRWLLVRRGPVAYGRGGR